MKRALGVLCLLAAAAAAVPAPAAQFEVEPASAGQEARIFVNGSIRPGDDLRFRRIAAEYRTATVILNSTGGAIAPAMDIGRAIRLQEYRTTVQDKASCASACALIWIAGSRRTLAEGGRVGFHASYQDTDGKMLESGLGNALVGHYLAQLGFGQGAVILATAAAPRRILWLTSENAKMAGIDFELVHTRLAAETPPELPPISAASRAQD